MTTYFGGKKGDLDITTMPNGYLLNARNSLARKLAAGEETKNTPETLAALDAELAARQREFEAGLGPTTTTGEAAPPAPESGDDEATF